MEIGGWKKKETGKCIKAVRFKQVKRRINCRSNDWFILAKVNLKYGKQNRI